jgi:F-type H+-transporting ATPase subunit alpha
MANKQKGPRALLYSASEPSQKQTERLSAFLQRTYGEEIPLRWKETPAIREGFRLEIGSDVYDWTLEGLMRQFEAKVDSVYSDTQDVIPLMRRVVDDFVPSVVREEKGETIFVGDEIARVRGLPGVQYGEVVEFEGGIHGMVQDLRRDSVGVVLFSAEGDISE